MGSCQLIDITCSFVVDEMKSPKDRVQRINDLSLGSTPLKKDERRKRRHKGNGDEPAKEIEKRTRRL